MRVPRPLRMQVQLGFRFSSYFPHLWHVRGAPSRATPTRYGRRRFISSRLAAQSHLVALPGFMTSPESQKAEKQRTKSLRLRLFSQVPQQKLGFRISNLDLMASSGEGILYTFFYSPLWPAYKSDPHHKWVLCKALSTESHFRSDRNFDLQDPFELIIGMIIYLCCSIKLINFGHPVEGKEIWNSKLPIELVTFLKFPMCNYVGKSAPNYPSNC